MRRHESHTEPLGSLILGAALAVSTIGRDARAAEGSSAGQMPVEARSNREGVASAIMGGLLRLDDTQIRQRWGLGDPRRDACSGDGCAPLLPGTGQALPLPLPFTQNRAGEWASFIDVLPDALGWLGGGNGSPVQVQDSNMFVTAAIAYPLFLIDESELPEEQRIVSELRKSATDRVRAYRHGAGFSFWPALPGSTSAASRVGPLNIPTIGASAGQNRSRSTPPARGENPVFREWSQDAADPEKNPHGLDALFNVPDDADDTSVGFSILHLAATFDEGPVPSDAPVRAMLEWRDLGRTMEDGRDAWKGKDSGALLTWLKDEDLPRQERFSTPDTGVIPLAVNNVDCVVNANALLALGLSGRGTSREASDVSAVVARAVEQHSWPECGLYYPQRMIFPYALSRAYRDGGVHNPDMERAMGQLLLQLLDDRQATSAEHHGREGAFSGGADRTFDLATALGLTTLLNIGRQHAADLARAELYDRAVEDAVTYLTEHQRPVRVASASTFNRDNRHPFYPGPLDLARTWDSGIFFSASMQSVAHWRSGAYTTAMVLEALSKYVLGYDLEQGNLFDGLRLKMRAYARNAGRARGQLVFTRAVD